MKQTLYHYRSNINKQYGIHDTLADMPDVTEKKMFWGVTFMVNGKMCISVGDDEILCRIDPAEYETLMERKDVRQMIHGGRAMKGWVFVGPEGTKTKRDLGFLDQSLSCIQ